MTVTELQDKLENLELPSQITAYGGSVIATEFTGKNIRPQMIVNYLSKGYIQGVKDGDKWRIDHDSFRSFLERYSFRNVVTIK